MYEYAMGPPTAIEDKEVNFSGTSDRFLVVFLKDPKRWENKAVSISGKILGLEGPGLTLSPGVYCQFKEGLIENRLIVGQSLRLKGRVIGYDDLLEELKLDQCIVE